MRFTSLLVAGMMTALPLQAFAQLNVNTQLDTNINQSAKTAIKADANVVAGQPYLLDDLSVLKNYNSMSREQRQEIDKQAEASWNELPASQKAAIETDAKVKWEAMTPAERLSIVTKARGTTEGTVKNAASTTNNAVNTGTDKAAEATNSVTSRVKGAWNRLTSDDKTEAGVNANAKVNADVETSSGNR